MTLPRYRVVRYSVDGLERSSRYVLTVATANRFGWSEETPEFVFTTRAEGKMFGWAKFESHFLRSQQK